MIQIEGDKKSLIITVLSKQGQGYVGLSDDISKEQLINKLIDEGILEDGESVSYNG